MCVFEAGEVPREEGEQTTKRRDKDAENEWEGESASERV